MLRLFANFSNCRYLCELECVAARVDDMGCRSARRNVHRSSRFRISHFSESIGVQVISPHFTGALEVFHACVIPAHDPCGVSSVIRSPLKAPAAVAQRVVRTRCAAIMG